MLSINEQFGERSVQTIKINNKLQELCSMTGLYLSSIIECSLIHFLKLNDAEKVQFLLDNDPDKVPHTDLKEPMNIAEEAKKEAIKVLGPKAKGTSSKVLIAIGLTLLVALFLALTNNNNNGKEA